MLLALFHLSVISLNVFTLWYDQKYVKFPFRKEIVDRNLPFENRVLFLTLWCFVLQTVYFTIALLNDLIGTNSAVKKTPIIRKIKDLLFALAFPIALYVSFTFWGIYAVDRELILPEAVRKIYPPFVNHVMHTLIVPILLIDILLTNRNYPSRKVGITQSFVFTGVYIVWLNYVFSETGVWVYPILDVMSWPVRILFFSSSLALGAGMYIIGEKIDGLVNKGPKQSVKSVKAKKR